MKKTVTLLMILLSLLFCGCESRSKGNVYELTGCDWEAETEGGGVLRLSFDGDSARIEIENGADSTVIEGEMLADDGTFVVFDKELRQNYGFSYVPRGSLLDLTYGGHTVEMHKTSG